MQEKMDKSCGDPFCRGGSSTSRCGFKANEQIEVCPAQTRIQPRAAAAMHEYLLVVRKGLAFIFNSLRYNTTVVLPFASFLFGTDVIYA